MKTEELQQLFDSVEAKQYKRPHERGPDWASPSRWMVTLDYSHLTQGGVQGLPGPAEAWQAQRGRRTHKKLADARRQTIKALRGSPHRFWQLSADAAAGPGAQHLQKGGEGVSGRLSGEPGLAAERLQQLCAFGAHEPAGGRHERPSGGSPTPSCWWPLMR